MQGTVQATSTIVYPDHVKLDLQTPQGNFSMVVTPDSAFMSAGAMGTRDMPSSRKVESLAQVHRDLIYIAQHVDDPAFSFNASGTDKVENLKVAVVDVSGPGVALEWLVDPETGKVVRETYKAMGMGQSEPVDTETDFSDWRPVEGLTLPFHRENKQGGEDQSVVQFTSFQLNPAVDPKIFEKPAAPAQ